MITESELRWASQFYLGRPPDSPEAVAYFLGSHGSSAASLQAAFLETPEVRRQKHPPASIASFCVWRPGRPRIAVAGHCNATNMGRVIASMADVSVYAFDPVNCPQPEEQLLPYLDDADLLLMPRLGAEFAPLDVPGLRARYGNKTLFYNLPVFEGLHPDLTYLGPRGVRVDSPIGHYHSKIAVQAYLDGLDLRQCLDRFAAGAVMALQPREIFAASRAEFYRRETDMDIRIADWFFRTVKKRPLMYTVNHLTSETMIEIARLALRRFGIDHQVPAPMLVQNTLASSVIWPVYPKVARSLGLKYSTAPVIHVDHYTMPMQEFLLRSYDIFTRTDRERLEQTARDRKLVA